jgi:hypothetical protein
MEKSIFPVEKTILSENLKNLPARRWQKNWVFANPGALELKVLAASFRKLLSSPWMVQMYPKLCFC